RRTQTPPTPKTAASRPPRFPPPSQKSRQTARVTSDTQVHSATDNRTARYRRAALEIAPAAQQENRIPVHRDVAANPRLPRVAPDCRPKGTAPPAATSKSTSGRGGVVANATLFGFGSAAGNF